MTNYIAKRIKVIFRCVLKVFLITLFPDRSQPPDFPRLLLFFVEIMSNKVILGHICSILKIFVFCDYFTYVTLKITKNENLQNIPNMTIYDLKWQSWWKQWIHWRFFNYSTLKSWNIKLSLKVFIQFIIIGKMI